MHMVEDGGLGQGGSGGGVDGCWFWICFEGSANRAADGLDERAGEQENLKTTPRIFLV